ncbi:MAG: helix-turn-helix transcriptional regulator [Planctomycetota bacterium]
MAYRVRTLGRITGSGRHSTLGTYFGDAMLTVVVRGRGRYFQRDRIIEVGAGFVGLVLPGADVGVLMADRDDPYDHIYCRFAGDQALSIARRVASQRDLPFSPDPRWRPIWDVLARMIALGRQGNERGVALAARDGAIVEALAILESDQVTSGDQARDAEDAWSAEGLRTYLRDRVAEPIDLDGMAHDLGVSRSTLTRRCRAALGQTVQSAWEAAKIELASALLTRTSLSVGEVAERVGYDPFYFSRRFRDRRGLSPSEWRRRQPAGP